MASKIYIIFKMNVDIFECHTKQTGNLSRDPSGIRFMVTSAENLDIGVKRLCNMTEVEKQNYAINLQLVENLIKKETDTIYDVIASLRTKMLYNNMMIDALKLTVNIKSKLIINQLMNYCFEIQSSFFNWMSSYTHPKMNTEKL